MPADSDRLPRLPARFRPLGIGVASVAFGAALLAMVIAVWLTLPEAARDGFTIPQRLTVGGMLLAGAAIAYALSRCRVDADEDGVTVVNGFRTRRFSWEEVVAVTLRPGSPWAVLDLSDGTSQSAMGIQGSDGSRAQRQTRQLRALIEAHAGTEPGPEGEPGTRSEPGP